MSISLTAGMRQNLFSLQQTTSLMEKTQSRLATGKKVQSALDDPLNFFASREHTQRADDLTFRKDAMGEAVQTIKAANNGIEAIQALIASAKSTAQTALALDATDDADERSTLAAQFDTLLDQIDKLSEDSGYKGINFLADGNLTVSFNADASNDIGLSGFTATAAEDLDIAGAVANWDANANITISIGELDVAKSTLRTESQKLTNNLSIITARQDFTDQMINTLKDGAADLVNADMNEEAANMLMLQTRQALGTTSLSMASQAAQSVLRLF